MLTIILFFIFLFGLAIGSFTSVIITRSHGKKPGLLWGRSECPHCQQQLKVQHLIPLLSYFWQQGKCAYCQKKIASIYPLLELTTGLTFVFLFLKFPFLTEATFSTAVLADFSLYAFYFSTLIAIAFSDVLFMEISPYLLLSAAIAAVLIAVLDYRLLTINTLWSLIIALALFGTQILVSRGKWLGIGDFYLALTFAIALPLPLFGINIIISYCLGALFAILLLVNKKASIQSKIPFTPFLILGTVLSTLLSNQLFFLF
ncbi:MAG: prepilin peptidase [Candidatus Abawacabacteria bacterium]|nr:prepilin peptidase [Candidatus Abawacabacteria bacterium]